MARAFVGAVSGDEDYCEWWLFEIPGANWFFVDPAMLPDGATPPRAELRLISLHPNGPYLSGSSNGEELPQRGVVGDYPAALEKGCVWRPNAEIWKASPDGTVAASNLPDWMR